MNRINQNHLNSNNKTLSVQKKTCAITEFFFLVKLSILLKSSIKLGSTIKLFINYK